MTKEVKELEKAKAKSQPNAIPGRLTNQYQKA